MAVVTGSNKGIGYEIVRGLAKSGVTTVLTARDVGRGQKAADSLKADGLDTVLFHQLDLNNADSIDALAVWVKDKFGGLDILVRSSTLLSLLLKSSLVPSLNGASFPEIRADESRSPVWFLLPSLNGTILVGV